MYLGGSRKPESQSCAKLNTIGAVIVLVTHVAVLTSTNTKADAPFSPALTMSSSEFPIQTGSERPASLKSTVEFPDAMSRMRTSSDLEWLWNE